MDSEGHKELNSKVNNLDPTEDGESSEQSHGAANQTKLGLQGHLLILLNLIISGRVEVDLDQLQGSVLYSCSWEK